MLHLINGLLIFWLLILLSPQAVSRDTANQTFFAAIVTTIWLVHPLQVSTVLYAVQRLVSLSTLFMLAALITYVKARYLALNRPIIGATLAVFGVTAFLTLGLLSKEIAILTPVLILIIELIFFRFKYPTGSTRFRLSRVTFLVIAAAPVALAALGAVALFPSFLQPYSGREFSLLERLLTEQHALATYLKLIFLPFPANMSLFHDSFPIVRALTPATVFYFAIVALIIFAVYQRKVQPWIAFGILWFFGCHLLESTFLPLELVFEHRNYLALLGPAVIVVVLIQSALSHASANRLFPPVIAFLIAILAFNTHARAMVWSNHELLLRANYENYPASSRVLTGLIAISSAKGDNQAALNYLRELQAAKDDSAAPYILEIEFFCNAEEEAESAINNALERLESGVIDVFTMNALRSISNKVWKGHCPAITRRQLEELLNRAASTGNYNTKIACHIHEANTRLYILESDETAALASFKKAQRACSAVGKTTYGQLIDVLLRFALAVDQIPFAIDVMSESPGSLTFEHPLKSLPDWMILEDHDVRTRLKSSY